MKTNRFRTLVLLGVLIAVTCVAMAYTGTENPARPGTPETPGPEIQGRNGIMALTGKLAQNRILYGGDGTVGLSLTLAADEVSDGQEGGNVRNLDMVIVLDRSGSMEGLKLQYAREAVLNLLSQLSKNDRFAMVSYSDSVQLHGVLDYVTDNYRESAGSAVRAILSGGGTNLGAGLREGIRILESTASNGNMGKLILISDGLANQGIIDPEELGRMASAAAEKAFSISTVGVGNEFNEQLMTAIADKGAGAYHYMENPVAFASVFNRELMQGKAVAAGAVRVEVPLPTGVFLVHAGGYPIGNKPGMAVFSPGNILSGQTRELILTFRFPTQKETKFDIAGINVRYRHKEEEHTVALPGSFSIACIADKKAVYSSIDRDTWERQVLQDDYNRLREDVALDIKTGNEKDAMRKIESYEQKQATVNQVVNSPKVADNLEKEVESLRDQVRTTFEGSAGEVAQKQKKNAKVLQFKGYKARRGMK